MVDEEVEGGNTGGFGHHARVKRGKRGDVHWIWLASVVQEKESKGCVALRNASIDAMAGCEEEKEITRRV